MRVTLIAVVAAVVLFALPTSALAAGLGPPGGTIYAFEPDGTCRKLEVTGEHSEPYVPELVVGICKRNRDRLVDAHVGGLTVDHVHEIPLGVVRRGREASQLHD